MKRGMEPFLVLNRTISSKSVHRHQGNHRKQTKKGNVNEKSEYMIIKISVFWMETQHIIRDNHILL